MDQKHGKVEQSGNNPLESTGLRKNFGKRYSVWTTSEYSNLMFQIFDEYFLGSSRKRRPGTRSDPGTRFGSANVQARRCPVFETGRFRG